MIDAIKDWYFLQFFATDPAIIIAPSKSLYEIQMVIRAYPFCVTFLFLY